MTVSVLIGIQARSSSSRFPRKSLAVIDSATMTEDVIMQARQAAKFLENGPQKLRVIVALLIPTGDELKSKVNGVPIIEGPEQDVLRRYRLASIKFQPQFICRLTGDCPLIPPEIISRHISIAVKHNLDYLSNVDPLFRTSVDGHDCEVLSKRLFDHVCINAEKEYEKEHVTIFVRENTPPWAKMGAVINRYDMSDYPKLSVDTRDDLDRVRQQKHLVELKIKKALERNYEIFRI